MFGIEEFKEDLDRYFYLAKASSLWAKMKIVLLTQGIWALLVYRVGHYVNSKKWNVLVRKPALALCLISQKLIEIICGISISYSAQIGKGLYIGHFGGIFIHGDVKIGECCNISQGVSIGLGGRGKKIGCPTIGDRVYVGPHAVILGKIEIGNDVAIGANAVVTKSMPDNAVVVGVPAKIISSESGKDFVIFRQKGA